MLSISISTSNPITSKRHSSSKFLCFDKRIFFLKFVGVEKTALSFVRDKSFKSPNQRLKMESLKFVFVLIKESIVSVIIEYSSIYPLYLCILKMGITIAFLYI